jgi:solute carrier family 35 protein F5
MFAVVGAVFYAGYSVVLKWKGEGVDTVLLFGTVGVCNFAIFFIGIVILNYAGIETFELPSGVEAAFLICNALFGTVLSDVLWALSVIALNPTLCTVGLSLTIPISIIADVVLYNLVFSYYYILGALLVICGFVIMAFFEHETIGLKMTNSYLKQWICSKRKD